jgi:hypothetical protein
VIRKVACDPKLDQIAPAIMLARKVQMLEVDVKNPSAVAVSVFVRLEIQALESPSVAAA